MDGLLTSPVLRLLGDGTEKLLPMQYTGLHDRNGVEIYEGDIVRLIRESASLQLTEIIKEVKWQKIGWAAYIAWKNIEVIGNIYSNPELLESNHDS